MDREKSINALAVAGAALLSTALSIYALKNTSVIQSVFIPYKDIGIWLKENTKESDKVATAEIGTVGFYSERYIIDILGLVNPNIARYVGERKFDKWLDEYQPDYFMVHDPFWGVEQSVLRLYERNELWERPDFKFTGYRLFCRKGLPSCSPLK